MLRLGKSTSDLPLIVIEVFTCYARVFDFYDVIEKPGRLGDIINYVEEFQEEPIYLGHLIEEDKEEYHISGLFE